MPEADGFGRENLSTRQLKEGRELEADKRYEPPKTWREHVREYWPEATDDDCSHILQHHTCWPYGGPDELLAELDDYMVNVMKRQKGGE
jgi:hypothetical protein